ncbi:MAG TPA: PAS domain-containing protein [Sulfurovum sp.]|uniref:PAS domain-containing protein n=1 Tax=Sulfurovum sp. TaxID=1969726 RepID=UPI002F95481D
MRYFIFMVLLVSNLCSSQVPEKVTLQLHWYHQFQFAGYYMAKEKGFYHEVGIDVEIKEGTLSQNTTENIIQKEADYATGDTSLIVDRSEGKKVVVLAAVLQASPTLIVTKQRPDIQSIMDLSGKHIDVSGTRIDAVSIRGLLNEKNIVVDALEHSHLVLDIKKSLMEGHSDAIVVYNTDQIYNLKEDDFKYQLFYPKDYGLNFYSDFLFSSEDEITQHPDRAFNLKKASLKGWEYAFSHIDETVDLILDKYNTQGKTREELIYEAQTLKSLAYYKTDTIGYISRTKMLELYHSYKKIGLIKKDIDLDTFIFKYNDSIHKRFTKKERSYLKEKKEITVCGQSHWRPYIDFTGATPEGIMVDVAKEYQKIIGIPLRFIRTDNWAECVAQTQAKEIDIAVPILTNPNHHQDLIPTKAIAKDHLVLVSKVEKPFLSDISDAGPLKVSICKGNDSYIHYIRSKYPNLEPVFVNDLHKGLESVAQGRVDAYLGTLQPITFEISQYYPKELKINGQFTELDITGSIGVHKSETVLLGILNKTIDALDPKIKREIFNHWLSTKLEQETDYSLILEIIAVAFLLLLILYYRQKLLKKEHDKLQVAYDKIHSQQIKLKEQKTIYELVFDSVTDGILMLEDGKIIDCNQAILKMLHYEKKEDLLNLTPEELSPIYQPDGRLSSKKFDEMLTAAFNHGVHRFEWIHTKATGEDFWTEITLTPIVKDNKNLLHVVWRDISKQKKLEYDNVRLRERMELAFRASRDGIWDWDIKNNTYYFSPRWKEMLGYRDDELENDLETWQALVHPDDLKEADKEIQRNLEGKTDTYEHKHRLRHKDGHWIWVYDRGITQFDDIGNAIRMIGTHTDLTNEMNLSNKLSELNHKLETTIELAISDLKKAQTQAKLGSWKLDLVHDILTWSDETYNIFEIPRTMELITYKHFINAIHPEDKEKVETAYYNSLKTQKPYEVIHRLLMPDGRVKYVRENCETVFDSNGEPLISTGTIQDITTEHEAVEELRRKDKIMFRQSRMAQMGEMINMIAHQWRQPLNAITMTTSALELKMDKDTYDRSFFQSRLGRIANYVQYLSSTIEDFREFFKPEKMKQETNFCHVMDDTLELVRAGIESKNITIIKEYDCTTNMVSYKNELIQVAMNLIKNAEDALMENKIKDPTINIKCYSDADKSVLEIGDNAGGIDRATMEKIFDPYFTTKEEHNGTGLGLYMSKMIVEEHCKGTLSVHNSSEGAVFKIEIKHA